jgi:hypothetical protein
VPKENEIDARPRDIQIRDPKLRHKRR